MKAIAICLTILAAVTLTYSNHFHNGFHFDDYARIPDNVYVRSLSNIPKFFTDTNTSAVLPQLRVWRPVVTTTLAVDYWLGGGYNLFYFHVSTFLWFLAQLGLMYLLFVSVLERTGAPIPYRGAAKGAALLAVVCYGLHPAIAETVNYINQRADVLSTCGVVAGIVIFIRYPDLRKYYLYLIPVAIGLLAKSSAAVFGGIALAWVLLFEEGFTAAGARAVLRLLPAFALGAALTLAQFWMLPGSYTGALTAYEYRISQPYVIFRYFVSFFLPLHLSADTDLAPLASIWTVEGLGGLAFLAALIWCIRAAMRHQETKPIAFGLTWFLMALVPTSLFPLPELENDHRMYFAFVGLVLAVTWAAALALLRKRLAHETEIALTAALACLLLIEAGGVRRRNEIWRTDETLWQDVTLKSPRNGRGLMNYGLTQMAKSDFERALRYFNRATEYTPNYWILEINLGIANGALNRDAEAEAHFRRALLLAPQEADPSYYFGQWLRSKGRGAEAARMLDQAIRLNQAQMEARTALLTLYAEQGNCAAFDALVEDTRRIAPNDPAVAQAIGQRIVPTTLPAGPITAEAYLDRSLHEYQADDFADCIQSARKALELRPNYAEAYNNIAAADASLGRWDEAITAAKKALTIKPDFPLARNNLAWAERGKRQQSSK
jgi:Flp pilus assembly protein TadD